MIEGVPMETKRPIILPNSHAITHLIVKSYHHTYNHSHNEIVVNELRQKFNINRLRPLVNKIKRECQRCKNEAAKPHPPEMCNLPPQRLATFTRPFSFTGVDFFGPLDITVGRHVEKRYGVIFTCMTVRAVHIDLADSLSTSSCILVLRNFINRRGTPLELWSDNGTNFCGANNELQRELKNLDFDKLSDDFCNIKWKFITPGAPHMGGCWERMIRTIKNNLNKLLVSEKPTESILRSALTEIEGIMNSRPLVYVPLNSVDDEVLTPNHFLVGQSSGIKPPGVFSADGSVLRQNWRISQILADRFWKLWIGQYLVSINCRSKWHTATNPLQIDDIVMLFDDYHRNSWQKGRIINVRKGADGQVRSVTIQTPKGIYKRPAVRVARLDVRGLEPNTTKSTHPYNLRVNSSRCNNLLEGKIVNNSPNR